MYNRNTEIKPKTRELGCEEEEEEEVREKRVYMCEEEEEKEIRD